MLKNESTVLPKSNKKRLGVSTITVIKVRPSGVVKANKDMSNVERALALNYMLDAARYEKPMTVVYNDTATLQEVDSDWTVKLCRHDWFYAFGDTTPLFRKSETNEIMLTMEAKGNPRKEQMLTEMLLYRSGVVSGTKVKRPSWFRKSK